MSPATSPPPAPAAPARPAAAGTAPATAPAKAPAAPAAAPAAATATPAAQDKKAGAKMQDMFKKVGSSLGGKGGGASKKTMYIILAVVIVLAAIGAAGLAMRGGSATPKKPSTVNLEDLQDWSTELKPPTANLAEGSSTTFNIADMLGENATGTYFVSQVTATLTWTDGPDERHWGRMRYNQPDVFQLDINSSMNASAMSEQIGNDMTSKAGTIQLKMEVSISGYDYFVMGNSSALRLPETVISSDITVTVYMVNAGDLETSPALFKWNDFGNDYTLKITVSGKVYEPSAKEPSKK